MSLFVGNISRSTKAEELEEEFDKIGSCTVNFKGAFAFVEFKEEKDAEDAIAELNNKNIGGSELSVSWSKKSGRFDPKSSVRPSNNRGRDNGGVKCYNCNKMGHFARDCK